MLVDHEFTLFGVYCLRLDTDRVVTTGRYYGRSGESLWVTPDLTKVDAVGCADLMPGTATVSGSLNVAQIEVYGKAMAR